MNTRDYVPELTRRAIIRRLYKPGSALRHRVELSDLERDLGLPANAIAPVVGGDLEQYLACGEYDEGTADRESIISATRPPPTVREIAVWYGAVLWSNSATIGEIDRETVGHNIGLHGNGITALFEDDQALRDAVQDYVRRHGDNVKTGPEMLDTILGQARNSG